MSDRTDFETVCLVSESMDTAYDALYDAIRYIKSHEWTTPVRKQLMDAWLDEILRVKIRMEDAMTATDDSMDEIRKWEE